MGVILGFVLDTHERRIALEGALLDAGVMLRPGGGRDGELLWWWFGGDQLHLDHEISTRYLLLLTLGDPPPWPE